MSVIFVFVDGVGLAPAGPDNPLSADSTPALASLLGGPLTIERVASHRGHRDHRAEGDLGEAAPPTSRQPAETSVRSVADAHVLLRAIDATLGVDGLPQSGTGQTAMLAGFNAARLHGRHQPHFPPTALRPALAERSIFRRVALAGGDPAFANLFGPGYWEAVAARRVRRSASVIAAEGAAVRFRDEQDYRAGRAVAWDITGDAMRDRGVDAPTVTPAAAGAALAGLAADHRLVFFETFLPDLAGHGRLVTDEGRKTNDQRPDAEDHVVAQPDTADGGLSSVVLRPWSVAEQIREALRRVDGLLAGALAALRPADTLLLTSDHGNIESLAAPAHTRNPVPLLAVGPGAHAFAQIDDLTGIADVVERVALDA